MKLRCSENIFLIYLIEQGSFKAASSGIFIIAEASLNHSKPWYKVFTKNWLEPSRNEKRSTSTCSNMWRENVQEESLWQHSREFKSVIPGWMKTSTFRGICQTIKHLKLFHILYHQCLMCRRHKLYIYNGTTTQQFDILGNTHFTCLSYSRT